MFFCIGWILSLTLPGLYSQWQEGMSATCRGTRLQRKMFLKVGLSFAVCNKAGELLSVTPSTFTTRCCHSTPFTLPFSHWHVPTPEGLQPPSWGRAAALSARVFSPSPEAGGGDQLLLSLHTSLSLTSPGRMNRFHCVLNSAFSLFLKFLLIHVFTAFRGKKRQLVQFCHKISGFI